MKIKRIWLYDNKKGHRWWSDVPNPEDKENAIKALVSTPVLEHAEDLLEVVKDIRDVCNELQIVLEEVDVVLDAIEKEEKELLEE